MRSQYLPLSSQNSFGHGGFESRHIQPVSTRQLKQPSPCTKFPSSHCSPKWGSNDPLPQVSFLHGCPSSGHAQPNSTDLQSAEQPSPSSSLPSSHASPELIRHRYNAQQICNRLGNGRIPQFHQRDSHHRRRQFYRHRLRRIFRRDQLERCHRRNTASICIRPRGIL